MCDPPCCNCIKIAGVVVCMKQKKMSSQYVSYYVQFVLKKQTVKQNCAGNMET